MGRIPVSSNQAEDFIQKYGLIIGGFLIALPLIYVGYSRINFLLISLYDDPYLASYGRGGLLFMTLGIIFLSVFFLVAGIRGKRK